MKLLNLVGFIIKKFVTMHGHRNVKNHLLVSKKVLVHFPLISPYLTTHGLFLKDRLHILLRYFKKERSVFENNGSHCKHGFADIVLRARFAAVSTQAQVAKYLMTIKYSVISQNDKASCAVRRCPPNSMVTPSMTSYEQVITNTMFREEVV